MSSLYIDKPQMKFSCVWCNQVIKNQCEENFILRGNICLKCSAAITEEVKIQQPGRTITQIERQIEKLRLESDVIALRLNENITKTEAKEVYDILERKWIAIQMLKKI